MPPLVEDEGSSSGDDIPFKAADRGSVDNVSEDEEEDEDEYVVEAILSHKMKQGAMIYEVKWEGYEDLKDRTWEPEDNLETAQEILEEYWKANGPRPEKKSRKRKANEAYKSSRPKRSKSETPELSTKKQIRGGNGGDEINKLPKGSWESHIASIDTIEESIDEEGMTQRFVYVLWTSGTKTRHNLATVNEKCPQKMLKYYESHLVFRSPDSPTNGEA